MAGCARVIRFKTTHCRHFGRGGGAGEDRGSGRSALYTTIFFVSRLRIPLSQPPQASSRRTCDEPGDRREVVPGQGGQPFATTRIGQNQALDYSVSPWECPMRHPHTSFPRTRESSGRHKEGTNTNTCKRSEPMRGNGEFSFVPFLKGPLDSRVRGNDVWGCRIGHFQGENGIMQHIRVL